MCFVFTCGEHTFRKEVEGYEGVVCRCYNCGNYSGHVIKSNPWFTFCFIVSSALSLARRSSFPLRASHPVEAFANPIAPTHFVARPPALDERIHRRQLPHLQLQPAAREPARRAGDARRGRSRNAVTESTRPAAGTWAWTTATASRNAVWMTGGLFCAKARRRRGIEDR